MVRLFLSLLIISSPVSGEDAVSIPPAWIAGAQTDREGWGTSGTTPSTEKDRVRRNLNGAPRDPERATEWVDRISDPTQVYMPPDIGMGMDDDFPAVGMTQHAANKFCQWLNWQTGRFYRLPPEADAYEAWNIGALHLENSDVIPESR